MLANYLPTSIVNLLLFLELNWLKLLLLVLIVISGYGIYKFKPV